MFKGMQSCYRSCAITLSLLSWLPSLLDPFHALCVCMCVHVHVHVCGLEDIRVVTSSL